MKDFLYSYVYIEFLRLVFSDDVWAEEDTTPTPTTPEITHRTTPLNTEQMPTIKQHNKKQQRPKSCSADILLQERKELRSSKGGS